MKVPQEFDEIRPYEPEEMQQAFNELLDDRQFALVLKGFVPWLPKSLRNGLLRMAFLGVRTPLGFQKRFMKPRVSSQSRMIALHLLVTIVTLFSILLFLMLCW